MFQVSYSDDPLPLLTTVDGSKLEQILPKNMENLRISHVLLRLCIFQVTLVDQDSHQQSTNCQHEGPPLATANSFLFISYYSVAVKLVITRDPGQNMRIANRTFRQPLPSLKLT